MESCVTCGQGPGSPDRKQYPQPLATVRCNGRCQRLAHPSCAKSSGIMLTAGGGEDSFWFCGRCRRELCPVAKQSDSGRLLDALLKLGRRMDAMDESLRLIERSVKVAAPASEQHLAELPVEVWTEIFAGLAGGDLLKVRLVCRRWRGIVDGSLALIGKIRAIFLDLDIGQDYRPENLFPVKKVAFNGCKIRAVGSWWRSFGESLAEIQIGNYCRIKCSDLIEMLKHVPNLKSLQLNETSIDSSLEISAANFQLTKLDHLAIKDIYDEEIYQVIPSLCCNLKSLKVSDIPYEVELNMVQFIAGLHNSLEELYIEKASQDFHDEIMKFDLLKLKKLALTASLIGDGIIFKYCKTQSNLEYLNIETTKLLGELTETDRSEFGKLFPKLVFLSFSLGSNSEVDLNFLSQTNKLKNLEIFGYSEKYYTFSPTRSLPNLQHLLLDSINFPDNNLEKFLKNVPNLRSLSIANCTFDCWSDLLEGLESLKLLERLSLAGMEEVSSRSFYHHDEFGALKTLHLNCSEMPQPLLEKLLELCPHVRELRVEGFDCGIEKLTAICRELTLLHKLSLVGCSSLPKDAERFVRERSRSLRELEIR